MRRMRMYLRPGNLYVDFSVEENTTQVRPNGRPVTGYSSGDKKFRGALAQATPEQKIKWQQLSHPITHVIVQDGMPVAKPEDKLVLEGGVKRVFLVQGVDEPGALGICTIYYAQERNDIK